MQRNNRRKIRINIFRIVHRLKFWLYKAAFSCRKKGDSRKTASADYYIKEEFEHVLAALMPPNRLAIRVSLVTGLRISDVLSIKTEKLSQRMTITEMKTGKKRRIYIPTELLQQMIANSGRYFVFEHRLSEKKHRTRQAVYKDLTRAARLFRVDKELNISPHSARKVFAVEKYKQTGDLKKVQKLLNHSNEAVTMVYAMADILVERNHRK